MRRCVTFWSAWVPLIALAAVPPPAISSSLAHLAETRDVGTLTDPEFDAFADCIERGDDRCIAAVGALRASGNAERGETVIIVLSRAIRTNPAAVLRLARVPDGRWLGQLCADNDIEASSDEVAAFRRVAMRALRRVNDPRLRNRRDACLRALARPPGG